MKLRRYEEGNPEVERGRRNLATVLEQRGKFDEAEALLRQILEQQSLQSKEDSVERAQVLNALAILLIDRDPILAAEAAQESLEIRQSLGLTSLLPVVQNTLATSLRLQGKVQEAEELYRQALGSIREDVGAEHRTAGIVEVGLATTLLSDGRAAEAEPLVRHALEIFHRTLNSDHWRVAEAESVLGAIFLSHGQTEEAAPLLKRGYQILEAVRGPAARPTKEARERLLTLQENVKVPLH
jgi:tetratricopeptide (TPR) repeat protein